MILSWVAIVVAVLAAAFSGWQAVTAHRNRRAANEGALVDWDFPTWPEPEIVEFRSSGPDEARKVWARLTINHVPTEQRARRVRQGEALRFVVPSLVETWRYHEEIAPRPGEGSYEGAAFHYGILIRWRTRNGVADSRRWEGAVMRSVRMREEPDPWDAPMPGAPT